MFKRVTVYIKVIKVEDVIMANNGKIKQDVVMADASGHIRVTLWEDTVNIVVAGDSYQFKILLFTLFLAKNIINSYGRVNSGKM